MSENEETKYLTFEELETKKIISEEDGFMFMLELDEATRLKAIVLRKERELEKAKGSLQYYLDGKKPEVIAERKNAAAHFGIDHGPDDSDNRIQDEIDEYNDKWYNSEEYAELAREIKEDEERRVSEK